MNANKVHQNEANRRPKLLNTSGTRYSLQRSDTIGLLHLSSKPNLANERELKVAIYCHISNPLKRWKVGKLIPWKMILELIKTLVVILHVSYKLCYASLSYYFLQTILFLVTIPNGREKFFIKSRIVFEELFIKSFNPSDTTQVTYTAFSPQQLFSEISYVSERVSTKLFAHREDSGFDTFKNCKILFNFNMYMCLWFVISYNYNVFIAQSVIFNLQYYQIPELTIGGFDHQLNESGSVVPILVTLQQYMVADLSPSTDTYILDSNPVTSE